MHLDIDSVKSRLWFLGRCLSLFLVCVIACDLFGQVNVGGVSYVSVPSIAKKLGLKSEWVQWRKTARMKATGVTISATLHNRHLTLNGNPLSLGAPIVSARGQLQVSERDVLKVLQPLIQPQKFSPKPGLRRIVIDPGHGGKDPGALNKAYGLTEKKLTLDVAQRLKRILTARGYQVYLTHSSDATLSRTGRTAIANRLKADLFISIHFNTVGDRSVSGVETWIMTPAWQRSTGREKYYPSDRITRQNNKYDAWNALAGYYLCDSLAKQLDRESRGLKRARFDVLTGLNSPAVLVECGFMSNSRDARLFATAAYREKIALGIADGVARYQRTLNRISAPVKK